MTDLIRHGIFIQLGICLLAPSSAKIYEKLKNFIDLFDKYI